MSIKHIPGIEKSWWARAMRKKWLVELVGSVPPLVVAGIGAYRLVQEPSTQVTGYWSGAAALWLLISSLLKIVHARELDKDAEVKRDHDGLRAAILVVHAVAGHACGVDPANLSGLRVTFHRVVEPLNNAQEIEQLVPYAGGDGGGAGRKFSIRSGITGRCIRSRQLYTMHRSDNDTEQYLQQLVADWGYTHADAQKLSNDKLSCMAVPVLDLTGKHAVGVIYLDGVQPNLFDAIEAQTAILEACAGVARYIGERYGR